MSNYYSGQPDNRYGAASAGGAQNLQFYPSSYTPAVSGAATPQQASYGYGGGAPGGFTPVGPSGFSSAGFGGAGVSGRMGEQGGLRTGWLAAFSTEGYDGEPPLLEELGVNFNHIQMKVSEISGRVQGFGGERGRAVDFRSKVLTTQARPSQFSTLSDILTNISWTTLTSPGRSSSSSCSAQYCCSRAKCTLDIYTAWRYSGPSRYT